MPWDNCRTLKVIKSPTEHPISFSVRVLVSVISVISVVS
jgi:hypothetical protein